MVEQIEKHKAKARRLLELAKRGVGGEQENAQRMLDELLAKHGISIDEIDADNNIRTFKIKNPDDGLLLTNIILSVNPYCKLILLQSYVKCTLDAEDHKEVIAKFRYFINLWRIEKDLLVLSFFTKHQAHFKPDEYAYEKFRDAKKEKNSAFEQAEKGEQKLNSNLSSALNNEQPKEFTQGQMNKQKQDMLNLNRMQRILPLMLDATYTRLNKY